MFMRESTSNGDVVKNSLGIDTKAVSDFDNALGAEGAFGVNVHHLAVASLHCEGKLGGDAHSVTQLSLTCTELTEHLSDRLAFDAATLEDRDVDKIKSEFGILP